MKRKITILLVVVLSLMFLLQACKPASEDVETLVVNVGPDPDTIDPALNTTVDAGTMIIHAFEGLMMLDKEGKPVPGQAESYEVSEDGKVYTFKLREGLKWSDGKPLTANDFVYAWNRAIAPETAADYEYIFEIIDGYDEGKLNVKALDDRTLQVTLKSRTPYFLELTAFPTFMPVREDIIKENGEEWATKVETYIGNGPYRMIDWEEGSYILFEKNKNYWNYDKLGTERIKFMLMEDDTAILNAFKKGEILFADSIPQAEIEAWKGKPEYYSEPQLGTYYISFNVAKEPLNNPKVRKALTLAIDREWIVKNVGKQDQIPAGAFVPYGITDADRSKQFRDIGGDFYDPSGAAYEKNLEEAKRLMEEAGYPDGNGFPTLEYIYNDTTLHSEMAQALQNMWGRIGVKVTLEKQEWNTFTETRKSGNYYIARNGWLCDYNDPISMLDMFITGSGNNDAKYSNAEYDELIKQIKATENEEERFKLMHDAEKMLFDDWVFCPIFYYTDLYLKSEKVDGFWSSPLGFKYFMYATIKD